MAIVVPGIPRPPERPEPTAFTPRSDFVRGTGADEFLHRTLSPHEKHIVRQFVHLGVGREDVLDLVLSAGVRRELSADEAQALTTLLDRPRVTSLATGLSTLEARGAPPFADGPAADFTDFKGDDRIFGKGGNDYIADLRGDNLVSTEDGNDHILLGRGNDRVFDRGGDNHIVDLGGNNTSSPVTATTPSRLVTATTSSTPSTGTTSSKPATATTSCAAETATTTSWSASATTSWRFATAPPRRDGSLQSAASSAIDRYMAHNVVSGPRRLGQHPRHRQQPETSTSRIRCSTATT